MAAPRVLTLTLGPDPAARLDKALAAAVPEGEALSRSRLSRLIGAGAVAINGVVVADAKAKVAEGDRVEITVPASTEVATAPEAIALDVAYEDDALIVINKPAGMVVHPAPGSPSGTLVNALLHHFGGALSGVGGEKRPGIVHRIDKDTSGLLVVAKSDAAHHGLAEQFAAHSVERLYLALCHGVPDPADPRLIGTRGVNLAQGRIKITSLLGRHKTDRQRQAVSFATGRHAVTWVTPLERFAGAAALIGCQLETGRTHQIRAHLAHIGHGLVGDPVYGGRRRASTRRLGAALAAQVEAFPRQALHAATLGFVHPLSGETLRFEAPMPADLAQLLQALRQECPPTP